MIKIDFIMLLIWCVVAAALGAAGIGIFTVQYWIVIVCLLLVEYRAEFVAKRGLK